MGDTLTISTDSKLWWGDGPEKIRIDGEEFPSHIGTGTEDYYGYSWGERALFYAPFHSQSKTPEGPGWLGTTVNTRLRSLDAIPFKKSLDLHLRDRTRASALPSLLAKTAKDPKDLSPNNSLGSGHARRVWLTLVAAHVTL